MGVSRLPQRHSFHHWYNYRQPLGHSFWNGAIMHLYGLEKRQEGPGGGQGEGAPGGNTDSSSVILDVTTSPTPTRTSSPGASATASSTSDSKSNTPLMIPIIGAIIGVLALILGFYFIRRTRIKHKNPKYIPTPFLKKAW